MNNYALNQIRDYVDTDIILSAKSIVDGIEYDATIEKELQDTKILVTTITPDSVPAGIITEYRLFDSVPTLVDTISTNAEKLAGVERRATHEYNIRAEVV